MDLDEVLIFISKHRDKIDWGFDIKKKRFEFEMDQILEEVKEIK